MKDLNAEPIIEVSRTFAENFYGTNHFHRKVSMEEMVLKNTTKRFRFRQPDQFEFQNTFYFFAKKKQFFRSTTLNRKLGYWINHDSKHALYSSSLIQCWIRKI
ncbi:hypothetical protein BpHYR1_042171 [Brachionus plicatilis]|uniref:Uncharacterized protein n=1 Tax=Brachionus plicatilis TaxID=10195 RepID=A0A3M7SFQ5_BRAPC|nr:hypothetical protein BpHYR1_042171 [Brachionus plicatilis]